jgi:hypothetical protein
MSATDESRKVLSMNKIKAGKQNEARTKSLPKGRKTIIKKPKTNAEGKPSIKRRET